ncbi:MAG: hypothetical protein NVS9B15_07820 [Acidobacteriaceae bacterium]
MADSTNHVAAFFRNNDDAQRAIKDLRSEGFQPHEIGCALGDYENLSGSDINAQGSLKPDHERGFWDKVTDFFTGNEGYEDRDTGVGDGSQSESPVVGKTLRVPDQYSSNLRQGSCLITVDAGTRHDRASEILVRAGGEIEQGFQPEYDDASQYAAENDSNYSGTALSGSAAGLGNRSAGFGSDNLERREEDIAGLRTGETEYRDNANRETGRDRIQLLSERLQVNKQRDQSGEARLRKEVITEQQNITVPVEREELVIERNPVNEGQVAAGSQIGTDREIRIPLSEERVNVNKQPVVREEVTIGKKTVQEERNVSDSVRREELRVENDVENRRDEDIDPLRRKSA